MERLPIAIKFAHKIKVVQKLFKTTKKKNKIGCFSKLAGIDINRYKYDVILR